MCIAGRVFTCLTSFILGTNIKATNALRTNAIKKSIMKLFNDNMLKSSLRNNPPNIEPMNTPMPANKFKKAIPSPLSLFDNASRVKLFSDIIIAELAIPVNRPGTKIK